MLHDETKIKKNIEKSNDMKEEIKLKEEINELKKKIAKYDEEHHNLCKSSDCLYLGLISIIGYKKSRNYKKAVQELSKSSDQGNGYASFILGLLYESGQKIERDVKKSFEYYEKSVKQGIQKDFYELEFAIFMEPLSNKIIVNHLNTFKKLLNMAIYMRYTGWESFIKTDKV